jgi:hypothetical protein
LESDVPIHGQHLPRWSIARWTPPVRSVDPRVGALREPGVAGLDHCSRLGAPSALVVLGLYGVAGGGLQLIRRHLEEDEDEADGFGRHDPQVVTMNAFARSWTSCGRALPLFPGPSWRTLTCFPDLRTVDGFDWVFRRRRIAVDGLGADSGVGPLEAGPKTRSGEAGPR